MQVFFKSVIRKTVEEMEEKIRNITRNFKYNKLMNLQTAIKMLCSKFRFQRTKYFGNSERVFRMIICLDIQNSKNELKRVFSKIQRKQRRSIFYTNSESIYRKFEFGIKVFEIVVFKVSKLHLNCSLKQNYNSE